MNELVITALLLFAVLTALLTIWAVFVVKR